MCVHHMVLTAFIGPKPEGKEARHRDGDPTNNALTNLRWSTHVENEKDKIGHGTHTRGERNGGAKLTQRQADSIRRRIANGEQARSIAREMGISEATVSRIKKGLRYAGRATLS